MGRHSRTPRSLVIPVVITLTAGLGLLGHARAEEKNPAVEACRGKAKGDTCRFTTLHKPDAGPGQTRAHEGACIETECCELDYSGGSPPKTDCKTCLTCDAPDSEGTPVPTPPPEPGLAAGNVDAEAPRTGDDPPAGANHEKRGCRVGSTTAPGGLALLALGLMLGSGRRRRQPQ